MHKPWFHAGIAIFACLIFISGSQCQTRNAGSDYPNPTSVVVAQPATSSPVPNDPAEMLQLAAATNGLDGPDAKSWHAKLAYNQFDEEGVNVHKGTIEEFYVGPKKYWRAYTGDTLNQTDVATDSGLYRSGDQRWTNPVELQVFEESLRPLYRRNLNRAGVYLKKMERTLGALKLSCVIVHQSNLILSDNGLPKFCFDPGTVRLRYTRGSGWDETTYNDFVLFQGRYVARDVQVTNGGKPFLKIHLEQVGIVSESSGSLFTPTADSPRPLGGRIVISSAILIGEYLISSGAFDHSRGVSGKVTVDFVAGKDGRVIDAQAVDGPKELRKAAITAMRKYRFKPFFVLDQPVEVKSSMVFQVQ